MIEVKFFTFFSSRKQFERSSFYKLVKRTKNDQKLSHPEKFGAVFIEKLKCFNEFRSAFRVLNIGELSVLISFFSEIFINAL